MQFLSIFVWIVVVMLGVLAFRKPRGRYGYRDE